MYSCLCNYYNKRQHDILKRIYAKAFYRQIAYSYETSWSSSKNEEPYIVESLSSHLEGTEQSQVKVERQNKGQMQSGLSHEEIWENLLEDCEDEDVEKVTAISNFVKVEPDVYNEEFEIEKTHEVFYADLAWINEKILLFLSDNQEGYQKAIKTGWTCVLVADDNALELLKKVGE